jgi:hypothetical protein
VKYLSTDAIRAKLLAYLHKMDAKQRRGLILTEYQMEILAEGWRALG